MNIKTYSCFIASPSDTARERKICDTVFAEINKGLGHILNCRIESLKWEDDVRPGFGESGQQVINDQIGLNYDLFVGIMYKKFGTKTLKADSGTEEEFNLAHDRFIKKDSVDIMFYFNEEATVLSEINPDEWTKVVAFKKKVGGLGLYAPYNGADDFEEKLRKHITKFLGERHSVGESSIKVDEIKDIVKAETLKNIFLKRFNDSMRVFDGQSHAWVEPVLSTTKEISKNPDDNYNTRYPLGELIEKPESTIISAPPQFGLTCLGHYMVKEAWNKGDLWIYLNSPDTKPHTIHNAVKNQLTELEQDMSQVKCIILDTWDHYETNSLKKLKNLCDAHKEIPVIVLQTIDDSKFLESEQQEEISIDREFNSLHLLALPRYQIRKLVSSYNKAKEIADEEILLSKVATDLDNLNIHRTAFNCLTLLKAAEKQFDESPVNRTKMLEQVLYVLFDFGHVPTYGTKPDVKDCEHVLGRYCEILIKTKTYLFSKESFISDLKKFCTDKLIDLEVSVVFEVLVNNNILIKKGLEYSFRSSFWIFYFAAKRMHTDPKFAEYIFSSKAYVSSPEIIEFYTGIDRSRADAIEILTKDIKETCDIVFEKVGMPDNINPYAHALWKPTEASIDKVQNEISENVKNSNLPDEVKDQYADNSYNQIRPYNQSIQTILEKYSLLNLMQKIKASSRALRNSDFVEPEFKRAMLVEIMRGWEQLSKVLLALAPIMAADGRAAFEGAGFELSGDFGSTFEQKLNRIIQVNPTNVVAIFKDDLYSAKLGPLLYENFENETNPLMKHHLALLIIIGRPNEWKRVIENYIVSLNKNSFYLYDTVNALRTKYRYDYASPDTVREMVYLIKLGLAKHEFGGAKPVEKIKQISNSNLPQREYAEEAEEIVKKD